MWTHFLSGVQSILGNVVSQMRYKWRREVYPSEKGHSLGDFYQKDINKCKQELTIYIPWAACSKCPVFPRSMFPGLYVPKFPCTKGPKIQGPKVTSSISVRTNEPFLYIRVKHLTLILGTQDPDRRHIV